MEKCVLFQTVTVCTMSMLLIACDEGSEREGESHFQNDDNLTMAKTITLLSRF